MAVERLIRTGGYDQKEVPPEYQEIIEDDPEKQKVVEALVSEIPESINGIDLEDATVLDIGTGTGAVVDKIKDKAGRVVALDKAKAMVKHLDERFSEYENVQAVAGDITEMPLDDNFAEVVTSVGVLRELPVLKDKEVKIEEIEDDFLREIMRVLKVGGVWISDSMKNAKNDYVKRLFAKKRKEEMARYKPDTDAKVVQRENIFLTDDIQDEKGKTIKGIGSRLRDLGFDCEVETLFDPEGKNQSAAVRIKLLNKL